jgi:glycosyltransferase involved in cell wall biosynthesis
MRILYVSPRQCRPAVSGAKLRDYHFARGLGTRSELTYVFFADPGTAGLSRADLPFCARVVQIPQPRMYTPAKVLRGVLGRLPLPLVNYTSPAMTSALRELLKKQTYDLVHLDSIHMMPYEHLFKGLPVVYDWHNIESEAMRRYVDTAPSRSRRTVAILTARKLEAAERHILRNSFGHIVCSTRERDRLKQTAPEARIEVVHNGVDLNSFRTQSPHANRFRVVFVGSMSYHANSDAALWFAAEVWPAVLKRHPEWRLTLVGSNPPPAVSALAEQPGIEVTGTVAEVKPWYEEALVSIVPLRTGGGTRLKILEAMAASVPVVSTELGAEGLPVLSGRDILLVTNQSQWVEALERVTGDTQLRSGLVTAAGAMVAEFDWDLLGKSLYEIYSGWLKSVTSSAGIAR